MPPFLFASKFPLAGAFRRQVRAAQQAILQRENPDRSIPVDLFGWSRGAVAADVLAALLQRQQIPVNFLGMIDPVATGLASPDISAYLFAYLVGKYTAVIASNVKNAYAAWTPNRDGFPDNLGLFTQIQLKAEDPTKTNYVSDAFPTVKHSQGGWAFENVGRALWKAALKAQVPLPPCPW